jgi:hypothetical protein
VSFTLACPAFWASFSSPARGTVEILAQRVNPETGRREILLALVLPRETTFFLVEMAE